MALVSKVDCLKDDPEKKEKLLIIEKALQESLGISEDAVISVSLYARSASDISTSKQSSANGIPRRKDLDFELCLLWLKLLFGEAGALDNLNINLHLPTL